MNIFIYDSFLNQKKYDRLLARIETRITDLGLNGKISRLSPTRNIPETIDNELRRGAKTIIAVGNNKTINQIVNSLAGSQVPLGIIPIGEDNNDIAASLGIKSIEEACDILSARLLTKLDLGLANQTYFLSNISIDNQGTVIDMNKNYTIETAEKGLIYIFNLIGEQIKLPPKVKFMPDDGLLELVINTSGNKKFFAKQNHHLSIFKIKKIIIHNLKHQLLLDGSIPLSAPAEITVIKKHLNVIIGKNRKF
ncbi:MAG: diacylglycerol kinase family protein [Patescibacteria group bacterium]|nr:diacylglycerol kinase family protein [Patescibacteria group bacterium]